MAAAVRRCRSAAFVAAARACPPMSRVHDVVAVDWIPPIPLETAERCHRRRSTVPWAFRLDPLSAMMMLVVTRHRVPDPRLLDRLHGRRAARQRRALLLLPEPVLLLHAHCSSSAANFLVMFVGWEGVGLCSYLLIGYWFEKKSAADAGQEGVHHEPDRRLGLPAGHVPGLLHVRHARLPRGGGRRGGAGRSRRRRFGDAVDHHAPAVRRRDGQERADSALRLAAGRHGGPDAGLGADPRGDHGHRRACTWWGATPSSSRTRR